MSYDIHIGPDEDSASRTRALACIEFDLHGELKSHINTATEHPILKRINHHYEDALFVGDSVEALKAGVGYLVGQSRSSAMTAFLQDVLKACDLALNHGDNIYGFCD